MKINIPKPIVPDEERTIKREVDDYIHLQKALEMVGYIVFKDKDEYLKSVQTLNEAILDEKQLG